MRPDHESNHASTHASVDGEAPVRQLNVGQVSEHSVKSAPNLPVETRPDNGTHRVIVRGPAKHPNDAVARAATARLLECTSDAVVVLLEEGPDWRGNPRRFRLSIPPELCRALAAAAGAR